MVEPTYRILVVDDELSMRELLEFMLEKRGYGVLSAANGKKRYPLSKRNPTIYCFATSGWGI